MSTPTTAPRRRWVWVAVIAAAAILVAGGIGLGVFLGSRGDNTAAPEPPAQPTTPQTPSTSATTSPPAVAGVDGCLGGDSRGPQAVLDAQAAAPQTPEGAVSFAIAFTRWIGQKPVVPAEEVALIDGVASVAPNLAQSAASAEKVDASQFYLTSLNGYYRVDSFTDQRVDLTLMLPLVLQGAIDPTLNFMPSYGVVWTDNGWAIEDGEFKDDANTLRTTGTVIPEGC
ncbi:MULTISPECIES: hypothetical protein [unclassified Microbacterium]|uniref:hypothetical protein n=1 Tax=unclassified Microbacterium TaxID=2609290 RepID=UPI0022AF5695|nr:MULTISPECIES: hypothetical protein [unclassified Microbacterium]MCZ4069084.1 hypothetical protein [Microbacterium sp. H37-C3]WHE37872.1 hypothetical protein P6897_16260 [Microbacterium sp. BDGP8]